MENRLTREELLTIIDARQVSRLREIFALVPTPDIADLFHDAEEDISRLVFIFKTVQSEHTAELFTFLDPAVKEMLIAAMSDAELVRLLAEQFTDDIVDDLEDMPANLVTRVLTHVSKEKRNDVNRLLNYKEDTAGSIMTTEYLALKASMTADEAISKIREVGRDKETIYTLFIRDDKRNLVGTLDLDDLIFAEGKTHLEDIMDRDYVTVSVDTDQEEVAQVVKRYDLNAIAVLNADGRLCGIITVDDIVDILEEEASEDIARMGLITPLENSYLRTSPWKMSLKCAPWIIVLLVLGTFASMILSSFQTSLAAVPVLAAFIPVLMDTGGNSGGQTISLMIRGLSLREFTPRSFWKILGRELLTALITAALVAAFAFLWFAIEQYAGIVSNTIGVNEGEVLPTIWNGLCWTSEFAKKVFSVAGLVALTMFVTVIVSKAIAVILPLTVVALKKDPAVVSQPLMTTIIDVTSLLIYFGTASAMMGFLGV